MQNREVDQLLGLANRARKIVTGEFVVKSIQNKTAKLVLIAEDASDNTKKRLTDKCAFYQIEYRIYSDSDNLSYAIGKSNRVAIAVTDEGFAKSLLKKLGG